MVGVILKAIFFYLAFVFLRSMIRGFFNFKVLKDEIKKQQTGYGQSTSSPLNKKQHDLSKGDGDIVEAEFKTLD